MNCKEHSCTYISFESNHDDMIHITDLASGRMFELSFAALGRAERCSADYIISIVEPSADRTLVNPKSLLHWIHRGWGACIPFYLLSRTIRYIDNGNDRQIVLDAVYSKYELQSPCPAARAPTNLVQGSPQLFVSRVLSSSPQWLPKFPHSSLNRRTHRQFKPHLLKIESFYEILSHSVARILETQEAYSRLGTSRLRYTKNFGAAFSFYFIVYSICNIEPGVYFLNLEKLVLELVKRGTFRERMSYITWGMKAPQTANYTLILTAHPSAYAWRYRHDKALRNLFVEAGRIMQMHLNACSESKLQGVTTPATRDDELRNLLDICLDSDEIPLYTASMGNAGCSDDA